MFVCELLFEYFFSSPQNYRAEKKKIEEENVILEKKISKVVAEIKTAEEKKEKLFQNECEKYVRNFANCLFKVKEINGN